jgi:hypothetical protein
MNYSLLSSHVRIPYYQLGHDSRLRDLKASLKMSTAPCEHPVLRRETRFV